MNLGFLHWKKVEQNQLQPYACKENSERKKIMRFLTDNMQKKKLYKQIIKWEEQNYLVENHQSHMIQKYFTSARNLKLYGIIKHFL